MPQSLRVLIVGDFDQDAAPLLKELRRGTWEVTHERVDTAAAMSASLDKNAWDLIIADYTTSHFSGLAALTLANQRGSDLPFILISDVTGEEHAVHAMKSGADDYLSRSNLTRLVPSIERELQKAARRRKTRQADHALEVSEIRFRRLFESAGEGILILDATTAKVLDVNQFVVELLGYPHEHFIGRELWEIGVSTDAENSKRAMASLQKLGQTRYEDLPLEHKDGRHIPVEFVSNVYTEGDREVIQCNIRDITARRLIEVELGIAKADAEAANRSKSEFLANMSHEIRTPMNAILGFADMMVHKDHDTTGRIECAQIIQRNALHLLELINEILDLSKIEARQMNVDRVPCDLPALLSEVVSLMRPRAVEKGLKFGVTFHGPIPHQIQSDPTRLRQILINLLGNARKFTESGEIDLHVTDEGAGGANILLRVDVVDSGIGMSSEQLGRLFQPFVQGNDSITRKFGGTGLGLAISQRLATLLSGAITVDSEVGKGSTFTLRIDGGSSEGVEQLHGLTEATLPAGIHRGAQADIRLGGRILLVEDGRDNQRLLRAQLSDAGADVISAENGQVAVDLATTQPFDLILMDMQMPVLDGYGATRELRRRGLAIPIIALTAYAMAEDRDRCMASGCSAYLTKPTTEETLLKTVSQHLRNDPSSLSGKTAAQGVVAAVPLARVADGSIRIKSSLAGNPRVAKILPEFVNGLPGEVAKMNDFLMRNDLDALKQVIHQVLGACGGYGFDAVSEPASRAEEAIQAGRALESIGVEIRSLIEVIRRIDGYHEPEAPATAEEIAQ